MGYGQGYPDPFSSDPTPADTPAQRTVLCADGRDVHGEKPTNLCGSPLYHPSTRACTCMCRRVGCMSFGSLSDGACCTLKQWPLARVRRPRACKMCMHAFSTVMHAFASSVNEVDLGSTAAAASASASASARAAARTASRTAVSTIAGRRRAPDAPWYAGDAFRAHLAALRCAGGDRIGGNGSDAGGGRVVATQHGALIALAHRVHRSARRRLAPCAVVRGDRGPCAPGSASARRW